MKTVGLATIQMMMMTRKSELMVIDTITVVALCEMMTPILLKNAAKDDLVLCFGKTKRGSALALMKTHEVYKVIYVPMRRANANYLQRA